MSRSIASMFFLQIFAACQPGGEGGGSMSSTSGAQDDSDTIPTEGGDPGHNSNYGEVLSGITLSAEYARIRVGHLDLDDVDGCCTDFVVAGPGQNHVKILFGAPSRGLVFLSDAPDQVYDMGPSNVGIEDVVVDDINEDGHDDVLALRSDGVVGIRHGVGASAPDPVLSDALVEATLVFAGVPAGRSLAVADLDCDGKNDVVAVSPENNRVVIASASGGDTFLLPETFSTDPSSPRQVVTGDLNGDDSPDIVTGNGDGSASVLLGKCEKGFEDAKNYPLFEEPFSTPEMQVAIGHLCVGEKTSAWPAIALGHGQKVFITCGSSTGAYGAVGEEPGSAQLVRAFDYRMDYNPNGPVPSPSVFQLQYWEATQSLYVLWSATPHEIARFVPSVALQENKFAPVADLAGRSGGHAFSLHQRRAMDGPQWSQVVVLVGANGATDVSFAR